MQFQTIGQQELFLALLSPVSTKMLSPLNSGLSFLYIIVTNRVAAAETGGIVATKELSYPINWL